MNWKSEWKPLAWIVAVFLIFFYLPIDSVRLRGAVIEALALTKWYAQEHVLLCLVPAFFIAGAIAVFVSQASVMKYLGAKAHKVLSYGVASVSGTILAVCSCTVLPLFAGIYRMGAGLGPATAFLYSGPAINVLAIVLTARVLGRGLGIARAVGAIVFSIVIGLLMHLIFRKEETEKVNAQMAAPEPEESRPLWQNGLYFAAMVAILVFANWGKPDEASGFWSMIYSYKWVITSVAAAGLGAMLIFWFKLSKVKVILTGVAAASVALLFPHEPLLAFSVVVIGLSLIISRRDDESGEWFSQTWGFAKQILPLLFGGVLIAGLLLGRPGEEGLIPSQWISNLVGGNSIASNLFASVVGAFMYFATLTEVPILQGLIGNGMGKGPALALLLAGPALSLPNMLVIRSVMGTKKTIVFVSLVVIIATISGLIYGAI
ncbi:MAG: permease [Candidatus Krumholzibacteriota bacterium]|nr:permease [Candidatus Krumholzibacteriota bacterium]